MNTPQRLSRGPGNLLRPAQRQDLVMRIKTARFQFFGEGSFVVVGHIASFVEM